MAPLTWHIHVLFQMVALGNAAQAIMTTRDALRLSSIDEHPIWWKALSDWAISGGQHAAPTAADGNSAPPLRIYVQDFLNVNDSWKLPALGDLDFSMDNIYGNPRCTGQANFVRVEDAPGAYCQFPIGAPGWSVAGDDKEFDQFALERIMLGKWMEYPGRCQDEECAKSADAVVVPSLLLHQLAASEERNWYTIQKYKWSKKQQAPWVADLYRRYWAALKTKFYRSDQSSPLILVHSGFTNNFAQDLFLTEQPIEFQSKVVLASLEANLRSEDKNLTKGALGSNVALELIQSSSTREKPTRPLMVTLPYPVSLLTPAKFTAADGSYDPARPRKIAMSLLGTARSKTPSCWIRKLVMEVLDKSKAIRKAVRTADIEVPSMHICASTGSEGQMSLLTRSNRKSARLFCGVEEEYQNLWSHAVNTMFCLQPAGDSLTRSHLYLAILSGCVPVIFDGGHDKFDDKTFWAWRGLDANQQEYPFIDYSKFAVVFNAHDVRHGTVDFVQELLDMPHENPGRLASLRAGLDEVAPRMAYFLNSTGSGDAFEAMTSVLRRRVGA